MAGELDSRRPIPARDTRLAAAIARGLTRTGITPNSISVLSVVFAAGACACLCTVRFMTDPRIVIALYAGAALLIPMRLLCNLFDGMVAIEGGKQTKSGAIYNELPDRFADALILVGAGYAVSDPSWAVELGWGAGLVAVMVAYVRTLGAASGAPHDFRGPMAKQHRMFIMILACVLAAAETSIGERWHAITIALIMVCALGLVTVFRRTFGIMRHLEDR